MFKEFKTFTVISDVFHDVTLSLFSKIFSCSEMKLQMEKLLMRKVSNLEQHYVGVNTYAFSHTVSGNLMQVHCIILMFYKFSCLSNVVDVSWSNGSHNITPDNNCIINSKQEKSLNSVCVCLK